MSPGRGARSKKGGRSARGAPSSVSIVPVASSSWRRLG
jgi:hypothetical protein